jgi:PAS domain S-box-containing protein
MADQLEQQGSLLVVDDEASLRETFHFFLTREGYAPVLTASTFDQALALIATEEIDLIISDIVLEKSNGIDLLKHIRENGIDCPFILITGYPDVETAAESLRFGAFDYIIKPVDKQTLLRSVRLALQQRSLELQRQKAEQERERYRIFLDTVFKSAGDAIIIVDGSLNIIKLNAAAQTLLDDFVPGVSSGANLNAGIGSTEFSSLRTDLLRVLRTGKEVSGHQFECKTVDGALRILSVCTSPLQSEPNSAQGAVIVVRDLTEPIEYRRATRSSFHRLIGGSDVMQTVYTLVENVGRVETTVLITGESGTGKELIAEAIHQESARRSRPLIKVDCTAIPENLLESELFGHKKGAFTGADKDRKGHILQADGGTLFLDEIGEISAMTQLRLLRFLQERTFYPVGGDDPIVVDTRVITATNVDLKEKVQNGTFREDLYFRLKVIDIPLPPLRERHGDVVLLARHFARKFGDKVEKTISGFSENVLAALNAHHWPGNVRELEHIIERAVVLCHGSTITTRDLPDELLDNVDPTQKIPSVDEPLPSTPAQFEDTAYPAVPDGRDELADQILDTLRKCGGNKAKAARLLGIDRSTLYRKISELNIDLSVIALE